MNLTIGWTACADLQSATVDGSKQYEARLVLTPATAFLPITPTSYQLWEIGVAGNHPFCSKVCPAATTKWRSAWVNITGAAYGGSFSYLPSGLSSAVQLTVYVGTSDWQPLNQKCATDKSGQTCNTLSARYQAPSSGALLNMAFRGTLHVAPAKGKTITPTKATILTGTSGVHTTNFCAPKCTARQKAWTGYTASVIDDTAILVNTTDTYRDAQGSDTLQVWLYGKSGGI
jgi:hypothetical protein